MMILNRGQWLWDALRFARASADQTLSDVNLSLGYFYQRRDKQLATTAYRVSYDIASENDLVVAELAAGQLSQG